MGNIVFYSSSSRTFRISVAMLLSLLLGPVGISSAQASVATTVSTKKTDFRGNYSAEDALRLLLAGVGPLAESNPRLLSLLGFAADRPVPTLAEVDPIVQDFMAYYPGFSSEVLPKLRSGKLRSVEAGLATFTEKFYDYLAYRKAITDPQDAQQVAPYGCGVTWTWAAVAAFVVANGALYANVAVATLVVVAGGAVLVLLVVPGYLANKDYMTTAGVEEIGRDTAIAELTRALR
ncbi:SdpC family antimicrobial peptide [Pseudarthrobacter sp. PvP004]|uniref:hypothetical protein n=1 Tax=Pseudarthrobacter sp. PvP004 TaxID=2817850 RepID=UPI001AE286E3|nr:hypothetical protein [Pseudarthrobacter sp. PvP004]MBP2266148.1 SdpC family antimicrobial peptide [Pseudarthrobacter sp. PvP004]